MTPIVTTQLQEEQNHQLYVPPPHTEWQQGNLSQEELEFLIDVLNKSNDIESPQVHQMPSIQEVPIVTTSPIGYMGNYAPTYSPFPTHYSCPAPTTSKKHIRPKTTAKQNTRKNQNHQQKKRQGSSCTVSSPAPSTMTFTWFQRPTYKSSNSAGGRSSFTLVETPLNKSKVKYEGMGKFTLI
jgi:hypothetical protein